jgi:translocation and assembly module TamA
MPRTWDIRTLGPRLPAVLFVAALSLLPAGRALAAAAAEPVPPDAAAESTAEAVAYKAEILGVEDPALRDLLTASSQLIQLMDRPPETLAGLERRAKSDLERLTRALRSEGYYAAELSHATDPESEPVSVQIEITPGPRYRLADYEVTYEGAAEPAPEIQPGLAELGLTIDMPARAPAILVAQQRLLALLAQRGYPLAEVTDRETFVQHEARTMTVHLRVDSGSLAHFGPQSMTGAESVEADYLRGLLAWREGDPYDRRKVETSRQALSATGLFSSVQISHAEAPDDDGALPMTIEIQEGPHRSVGAGLSYASDIGFGTEAFWEHRNFFGANESLRLSLTASEIEQGGKAAFRKPTFLRLDQALLANLSVANQDTDAYDGRTVESFVGLERPWREKWLVTAGLSGSYADLEEDEKDQNSTLGGVPLSAVRDDRDNALNPTRGTRLNLNITPYAGVGEDKSLSFLRSVSQATAYYALDQDKRFVLAGRAKIGWLFGEDRRDVPANKRFYAGGGGSIRGYEFQKVGPLDKENDPLGGRSLFEVSGEMRIRAGKNVGFVPFIDGGNVFGTSFPDFEDKLRWAAGLGLRYFTGVGPLRFDVAFPLNSRDNIDDDFQFYISFGQAF